jgi:glutathione S-transferase
MQLYDYPPSGNGYKVRLLLAHLARPYRYVPVDILAGESRTPEFLARNPNGRIPVLELDDGTCLAESNAILYYLAQGTRWWPDHPLAQAQILQWMCFEQYSHEPNIATVRFWLTHKPQADTPTYREILAQKRSNGQAALAVMERHLAGHDWFVGGTYSIADIALYAYTHVADEGGFDLAPHAAVRAWLARVCAQPGHVGIDDWPRD